MSHQKAAIRSGSINMAWFHSGAKLVVSETDVHNHNVTNHREALVSTNWKENFQTVTASSGTKNTAARDSTNRRRAKALNYCNCGGEGARI